MIFLQYFDILSLFLSRDRIVLFERRNLTRMTTSLLDPSSQRLLYFRLLLALQFDSAKELCEQRFMYSVSLLKILKQSVFISIVQELLLPFCLIFFVLEIPAEAIISILTEARRGIVKRLGYSFYAHYYFIREVRFTDQDSAWSS